MSETAPTTDFAPPVRACPTCGTECKRHSVYTRRVRDISLDRPAILEVRVGNYRCPACRKFFKPEVPFAPKGKRYTARAVRKATVSVQEDKTTYTGLPHRLDRDFSIRPAKSTSWAWFQSFAEGIDIEEYLRWACGRFSGQLSVDSIMDGGIHTWIGTDPLNRDLIIGYHRAEHADTESLKVFLTRLRDDYGIRPALFTGDDASVFLSVPQEVWPGVPVQLCHFHSLKRLNYTHLRHSLKARLNKLKPAKPCRGRGRPRTEDVAEVAAYRERHERWVELFRKRRLFFKSLRSLQKPRSVEAKEAEFLEDACRRYKTLRHFRRFVLDFYELMDSKDRAAAELLRRAFLAKWAGTAKKDKGIGFVMQRMADDSYFARLFAFAAFENAHRTTNSTERANRWFRKRQKTHYRNRTEATIRRMLHADLIYRRERTDPSEPPAKLKARVEEPKQSA